MPTQHIHVDGSGGHSQGGWGSYGGPHNSANQSGAVSGPPNSARAELTAVQHGTAAARGNSGHTVIHTDFKQAADAHKSGYSAGSTRGANSDVYQKISNNVSSANGRISVQHTSKGSGHSGAHQMASKGAK